MKIKKKIAIVGAGFFGCTLSLILSKKFDVDLYERKPDISKAIKELNYKPKIKLIDGIKKILNEKSI